MAGQTGMTPTGSGSCPASDSLPAPPTRSSWSRRGPTAAAEGHRATPTIVCSAPGRTADDHRHGDLSRAGPHPLQPAPALPAVLGRHERRSGRRLLHCLDDPRASGDSPTPCCPGARALGPGPLPPDRPVGSGPDQTGARSPQAGYPLQPGAAVRVMVGPTSRTPAGQPAARTVRAPLPDRPRRPRARHPEPLEADPTGPGHTPAGRGRLRPPARPRAAPVAASPSPTGAGRPAPVSGLGPRSAPGPSSPPRHGSRACTT